VVGKLKRIFDEKENIDGSTACLRSTTLGKLTMKKTFVTLLAGLVLAAGSVQGQVLITNAGYTQNFDSIGTGLPTGWDARTGATATALGTVASFTTGATSWDNTTGAFKNFAATTGLSETSTTAAQSASTDRAFGIRQTNSFGDPGASFNFHFSTTGVNVTNISFDAMMTSVQTRSTVWSIQYGVGASPTSFTTLGTYSDPGIWGSTGFSFTTADFGTNLDNQANLWFRVVALSGSTGTGSRDSFAIDNFNVTAIPEPSTYALIALGLGALVVLRRRASKIAAKA
jgi:hypothetical protein